MTNERPVGPTTRLRALFPNVPDEDLAALQHYTVGNLDGVWGLGERPAVLVIDMTTGFVEHPAASTFVPSARECIPRIQELLRITRAEGFPTIYSKGSPFRHEAEAGAWLRGRGMDVLASSNAPSEREIVADLAPTDDDIVIIKSKHSAFFGTPLHAQLNYLRVDSLIVTGTTTSGCIRATVNDAFALNYRIVVPVDCVADRSGISHEIELFDMAAKYADVLTLAELLEAVATRAPDRQRATGDQPATG